MASILMDVLTPEIDEKVNNDRRTNLFIYVQDGAMNLDYAAKQANLSTADFQMPWHLPVIPFRRAHQDKDGLNAKRAAAR